MKWIWKLNLVTEEHVFVIVYLQEIAHRGEKTSKRGERK